MTDRSHIAKAERHVRRGAGHIERQQEIVAQLEAAKGAGRPLEQARELLAVYRSVQAQHERHLARLRREDN
jgi:hypothetical protein